MPEIRKDRVRMLALNYRKPGMSFEDYDAYWRGEHYRAFSSMKIVQENLLKYEQCHRNAEILQMFKEAGMGTMDCDGIAIFEAESYEKIMAVFTSDEYQRLAVPDEEKFLDRSRIFTFPADLVTVVDK